MLLWLKFPVFVFRLSMLLLALILKFLGFKLSRKPLIIANFLLLIVIGGLGYYYVFYPPETKPSPPSLDQLGINSVSIIKKSDLTQKLTQDEVQQKLNDLENNLGQQLRQSPTLLPQKTYLNLMILSHYAGEDEKASQYLNQARFTDPNNDYFN